MEVIVMLQKVVQEEFGLDWNVNSPQSFGTSSSQKKFRTNW